MAGCLRLPVKLVAIIDVILTIVSLFIVLAIIQDVYNTTPSLSKEIKTTEESDFERESNKEDNWMTKQGLTFEERSMLMREEHEKWRREVNQRNELSSRDFFSDTFSGILFIILWVIFSIFLLALACFTVLMGIRLFLVTNKSAHRNDICRTLKCWIVTSLIFTILFIVDCFIRQPQYPRFMLGLTNISFRSAAIVIVILYFWQIRMGKEPGDSDRGNENVYGMSENNDDQGQQEQYPSSMYGGQGSGGWMPPPPSAPNLSNMPPPPPYSP